MKLSLNLICWSIINLIDMKKGGWGVDWKMIENF